MEDNIPQNVSLPPLSSTPDHIQYFSNPNFIEEEINDGLELQQIAKLKETIQKHEETIKEKEEIIDKKDAEILHLKKEHEKEKAQIIAENNELKNVFDDQRETITQLTLTIQKLETAVRQKHYQNTDLSAKLAYLIKPKRICTLSDTVVNKKIDYKRLDGKVLVFNNLEYTGSQLLADNTKINFADSNFEICITNKFYAIRVNLSSVINRIFYSTIKELYLIDTSMTYFEYKKLSNSLQSVQLIHVTIKDKYGTDIRVSDLIKDVAATVEMFKYVFKPGELISGTAQRLAALPPFPHLEKFFLWDIQEGFDLLTFFKFIKNNPTVFSWLDFNCSKKFFDGIRNVAKELLPILPKTCNVQISRYT